MVLCLSGACVLSHICKIFRVTSCMQAVLSFFRLVIVMQVRASKMAAAVVFESHSVAGTVCNASPGDAFTRK